MRGPVGVNADHYSLGKARFFVEWALLIIILSAIFGLWLIFSNTLTRFYNAMYGLSSTQGQLAFDYSMTAWVTAIALAFIGLLAYGVVLATKREDDTAQIG